MGRKGDTGRTRWIDPPGRHSKNSAPPVGGKGPLRIFSVFSRKFGATRVEFEVESRDKSIPYLRTVSFERPLIALDPGDFDTSRFRAYQVIQADHAYAIERRSSHRDAVLVRSLRLSERVVHISFSVAEWFITEPLAIKLIDQLLLRDLMKNELFGKYDMAEYFAEELDATTRVPATSP